MLESIQSLRRHYPDQVRGYVLSLFTLPRQGRHPFVIRRKNRNYFNMSSEKKDSLREWSSYYSHKAAVKTGS